MMHNIKKIQTEIKNLANSLGIQKFDVNGSFREEICASSKNKNPFALSCATKTNFFIRVWNKNNQVGVTNTSNLTNQGIKDALEIALESSHFSSKELIYEFSESCLKPQENVFSQNENSIISPIQDLANECVKAESFILDHDPVFKSVPYNKISESLSGRFYFNSNGVLKSEKKNIAYCYFYPLAQEEGKHAREAGHISIVNGYQKLNVLECAKKALEKTIKHLNYTPIKSGKYSVLFSPESFLDIMYSFANFMNAQNILDKKSLSTIDSLGKEIASPLINLYDAPLHTKNVAKTFFDYEGTNTQETEIIKNGILKNFLHSSYTAKKFLTTSTGHANSGAKITISPHFLHIRSNENTLALQDKLPSEPYIYIENVKSLHAGVNALQGSFSLPFDGFIVDNNKKTSIESATVAGDFLTLLKNICYVDSEEELTVKGICPKILIKDLAITGNG